MENEPLRIPILHGKDKGGKPPPNGGVPTGSGGEKQLPAEIHSEMACRGKAERPVLIVRPVVIPFPIDRSEREEGFFLSVF